MERYKIDYFKNKFDREITGFISGFIPILLPLFIMIIGANTNIVVLCLGISFVILGVITMKYWKFYTNSLIQISSNGIVLSYRGKKEVYDWHDINSIDFINHKNYKVVYEISICQKVEGDPPLLTIYRMGFESAEQKYEKIKDTIIEFKSPSVELRFVEISGNSLTEKNK